MKIKDYTDYFHDGDILDVKFTNNDLDLCLVSAEVHPEDISDSDIILTSISVVENKFGDYGRRTDQDFLVMAGELSLINIKDVTKGSITELLQRQKYYDLVDILHLEIDDNRLFLTSWWSKIGLDDDSDYYFEIELIAEQVKWKARFS